MDSKEWFVVEQGMFSPRDGAVGYRFWAYYDNLQDARTAARKLQYSRVLVQRVVVTYEYGKVK